MSGAKLPGAGIAGSAVAALCCGSSILAAALGTFGPSSRAGYVVVTAAVLAIGAVIVGLRLRSGRGESSVACCDAARKKEAAR